jgi:hypothetical protein
MKKVSKTNLKKKCDALWSQIVRSRGACEVCGNPYNLNAHHIAGRSIYILRFDLRNGACLCAGHHKFFNLSAHENSPWFTKWMQANRPDDLEYINFKSEIIAHYTIFDYEKILSELKEKL